jgi:2-amino-4-hydroxy-6-hydroxymethyldihydropteridine diphosphokinase
MIVKNHVFIALGSNIDKERNLPRAATLLRGMCKVKAFSSVYETVPVGLLEQPNFFNSAALLETELSAPQVKSQLLAVLEKKLNRVRTSDKNAPRTIDADIILYNDAVFEYTLDDGRRFRVPDPDLTRFAHVAVPIAELSPNMLHPESAEPLSSIASRLMKSAEGTGERATLWKRPDVVLV